jgi:hypothetical protein
VGYFSDDEISAERRKQQAAKAEQDALTLMNEADQRAFGLWVNTEARAVLAEFFERMEASGKRRERLTRIDRARGTREFDGYLIYEYKGDSGAGRVYRLKDRSLLEVGGVYCKRCDTAMLLGFVGIHPPFARYSTGQHGAPYEWNAEVAAAATERLVAQLTPYLT